MEKVWGKLRFLLVAGAITLGLSGCGGSSSSSSAAATSTAKTAAWTNVSVRAYDGKININWDKAAGSTFGTVQPTYNIYCSSNPAEILRESNRIATNYSGTSFDHTDVTNGQRYYYVVTEVSAAGESPASRLVSATPEGTRPAAPYGLKVTALDKSVKLEFMGPTLPSNVNVNYYLYRSTSRDLANPTIKSYTLPSYPDTDLDYGKTYYYSLKAVIAGKESSFSPVVSARPQADVAAANYAAAVGSTSAVHAVFGSPASLTVEPGNGACIISWTDAVSPSSFDPQLSQTPVYTLYWSTSPDVIANKINQIDNATKGLKLNGLTNGTTYYLQLVAATKDIFGNTYPGPSGPVVSVTPSPTPPAVPVGVSATQGSQQVMLTWSKDSSGMAGVTYNIYYSTSESDADTRTPSDVRTNGTPINNVDNSKTYFTHTGRQPGTTYYYVVTAAVGEGESAPSGIISVTL